MRYLRYSDETLKKICALNRIIIYGAGTMGRALKVCLESEVYRKRVAFFLVRDEDNNPLEIDGCPVVRLSEYRESKDIPVIVALNEKNLLSATKELRANGFTNMICLNAAGDSWQYLKGNYFAEAPGLYLPFAILPKEDDDFPDGGSSIQIYVVKSVYDKEARLYESNAYERDIQVGAALTEQTIADIRDDVGDNISSLNKSYCELTALYWLWKNASADYIGLSHYRRRFDISKSEAGSIVENDVDVALTVPVMVTRGIKRQYGMDHSAADWQVLSEEMRKIHPDYADSMKVVEGHNYFYAYNMFIMKRNVLEMYCEWLFPVLFACTDKIGEKIDAYQNRYAGFMAERLLNVFLYHNKEKLKIAVVKRKYLGQEIA